MAVYLDSLRIEMEFDGVGEGWTDVTADVLSFLPITGEDGIRASGELDRVATTGKIRFTLRNDAWNSGGTQGYYSPGTFTCRPGFGPGIGVRLVCEYLGETFIPFYGRIPNDGIQVESGILGNKRVTVEARDWMEQAAIHELDKPEFAQNKRMDEIMALIVDAMPVAPLATDYETGETIFDNVFDTVRDKTRALAEFQKLAVSELGYIYVRRDTTYGEMLRSEGRYTRNAQPGLSIMTAKRASAGFLKKVDGWHLIKIDDGKLKLSEYELLSPVFYDSEVMAMETQYGADLFNRVRLTSYPRTVDSAPTVLWVLQNKIALAPGESTTINARYRDPTGGARSVSGIDMIDPVAQTDYRFNSQENGLGYDLTSNLEVVAVFGTNGADLTLTNNGSRSGFVPAGGLQVRGTGVYLYNTVETIEEDVPSQATYGQQTLSIDMKYQVNPLGPQAMASILLARYKDPAQSVKWIEFIANKTHLTMNAFLRLGPGDRIQVNERINDITGDFFINGRTFQINDKIIRCRFYLRNAAYEDSDIFIHGVDAIGSDAILGY